jgi:nitrite reductase/ring-hydroxylating ferredoxin subunit/uncharacterized membrane protein
VTVTPSSAGGGALDREGVALMSPSLHDVAAAIGRVEALDRLATPLRRVVERATASRAVKDALSGTWLGHPLHPVLTDIPIGSFTSASVLDLLGGRQGRRAADLLVALGLISAVPTAAAGLSDWSDTDGDDTRVGVVHASANVAGLVLYAASLRARLRGRRASGTALALAGMGAMTVGGFLGGHLTFGRGVGVDNAFWQHGPDDWTAVLDAAELGEGATITVQAGDASVLLHRRNGAIVAIGSRCSHAGGPLGEGKVEDGCVTCPWHQSVFRLDSGAVVHGPATSPQLAFDTRVQEGRIEVRRRAG